MLYNHSCMLHNVVSIYMKYSQNEYNNYATLLLFCKKNVLVSKFSGQKKVLQCLLEIRNFFSQSEPRYLLNQLYITDYCIWIQKVKDNKLISLADSLKKVWWCEIV